MSAYKNKPLIPHRAELIMKALKFTTKIYQAGPKIIILFLKEEMSDYINILIRRRKIVVGHHIWCSLFLYFNFVIQVMCDLQPQCVVELAPFGIFYSWPPSCKDPGVKMSCQHQKNHYFFFFFHNIATNLRVF